MLDMINQLPDQCEEGWKLGKEIKVKVKKPVKNVLVLGMGGSAIGGDIMKGLAQTKSHIPFTVNRDYSLPEWVGTDTLAMVVSYSGNTEETLSALEKARQRQAITMGLSSGGKLAQEFSGSENFIRIPPGLPPRAALGYTLFPLLAAVDSLGIMSVSGDDLEETFAILKEIREEENNQAGSFCRELALNLKGSIPLIYGGTTLSAVAAVRWKCQFNENSKTLAFSHEYPELNHNEIVGWEVPPAVLKHFKVIHLLDEKIGERTARRMAITGEILSQKKVPVYDVQSRGNSDLARIMSLILVGDYTSYFLALEYGVDPVPVRIIEYLKKALQEN